MKIRSKIYEKIQKKKERIRAFCSNAPPFVLR